MDICNWVNSRKKNVDYSNELTEANHDELEPVLMERFERLLAAGYEADDVGGVCIYYMAHKPVGFYDYENGWGYIDKRAVKSFA